MTGEKAVMNKEINNFFRKMIVNSLETGQTDYLGAMLEPGFNVYRESGFHANTPLPRMTAADVLLRYFTREEDIVALFTILLRNEGSRFYNAILNIWGRDDFIKILKRYKWIFDPSLVGFSRDPFYEHEINLLKKIQIIDLRHETPIRDLIREIEKASAKMSVKDLEWRITLRLYDLDASSGELIRKILILLLSRQNLQEFMNEIFVCLKELAINASKANYKILFEKHVTRPQGITPDRDYIHFLRLFKSEIEEHGNSRLFELARQTDRYITITFQSTIEAIEVWVSNNQSISLIEKRQIVKKIKNGGVQFSNDRDDENEYIEGAGFGLNMILSILKSSSRDPEPLKVVFYPDFIKIGFTLLRSELHEKNLKIMTDKESE